MSDWRVRDEVYHWYYFPTFTLAPGAHVKLHTGCGTNSASHLYWCQGRAVWNNSGDTIYLYDDGNLVDAYSY